MTDAVCLTRIHSTHSHSSTCGTAQRMLQRDLEEFTITESFRVAKTSQITEQREEPVGHHSPGNQAWFTPVFNTIKVINSLPDKTGFRCTQSNQVLHFFWGS